MIALEQAKQEVEKVYGTMLRGTAIDIGDAWVFPCNFGEPPIPGFTESMVDKQTGEMSLVPTPATEPDDAKLDAFYARFEAGITVPI